MPKFHWIHLLFVLIACTAVRAEILTESSKLVPPVDGTNEQFGYSMAMSDHLAAVASFGSFSMGKVYVFDYSDPTAPTLVSELVLDDVEAVDGFGEQVAISGERVLVGTYDQSVYLFDAISGEQLARLTTDTGHEGDGFGRRVAMRGHLAIVTADDDLFQEPATGAVYIFDVSDPAAPALLSKFYAPKEIDSFGRLIADDGNTLLIAGKRSVHLFDLADPTNPVQLGWFSLDDEVGSILSLDIDEALAVFGTTDNDNWPGGTILLDIGDRTSPVEIATILPSDGLPDDDFGYSVSLDEGWLVVGARYDDEYLGSAYAFDVSNPEDVRECHKLLPFIGEQLDFFGGAVVVNGSMVLVGSTDDSPTADGSVRTYNINSINCGIRGRTTIRQVDSPFGPGQGYISAINNHGQAFGRANDVLFIWSEEGTVLLDTTGFDHCVPLDLNDDGEAVALCSTDSLLWSNGSSEQLPLTYAFSINNAGQVAGGWPEAAIWEDGEIHLLGSLGAGGGAAVSINEAGEAVGYSNSLPFRWSADEGIVALEAPPGEEGAANDINDAGLIVGVTREDSEPSRAAYWDDEGLTSIHPVEVDVVGSYAQSVNNSGIIVGELHQNFALIVADDKPMNLEYLLPLNSGWRLCGAVDINDRGQIVAVGMTSDYFLSGLIIDLYADCPADLLPRPAGDTRVDVVDFQHVLASWGECGFCPEDIDHDGVVGVNDLLAVLGNWGPCPAQ